MPRRKAAYLIWKNPYMTIGGDTFIHDMMQRGGFDNAFANATRYPVIDISQLQQAGCEVVFCSTEPYPFKLHHLEELQEQVPQSQIVLADGEAFSWYGSRLIETPLYLETLHQSIDGVQTANR
jgi:ABC-type Fe3+-hydroxamate transport system substrate-binding protein